MITAYIRFLDGTEMYRTLYRCDLSRDSHVCYIWDTPQQVNAEQIRNATVEIFIAGQHSRTYRIGE